MAFEHTSGVPGAYDRAPSRPDWARVVAREGEFAQAAELNEIQTIIERRGRRVGDMTAKDGDRIEGADINIIEVLSGAPPAPLSPRRMNVVLQAGRVYAAGDVRSVPAATFSSVLLAGEVIVGVKLQSTVIDSDDDPALLGLHPGTVAEGEPGASRVAESLVWAIKGDSQPGEFYSVYLLIDGGVIDQAPPPALSGVIAQVARYDRDALGNYIVDGCNVTALGKVGSDQIFSVEAGTANISGFKRIRESAIRFAVTEDPDLEAIAAEPHTFSGPTGGSTVITVSRAPIASVTSAIVVKRVTEVVVRGAIAGGSDDLGNSSIVAIESIVQGTTISPSAYTLAGDAVSWAPAGTEPASGSTYSVTYLYNAAVTPSAVTDETVTVSGGVNGTTALISYTSKLPRIDIIGLEVSGRPVSVKGVSARAGGLAPMPPSNVLKLAEVYNNWLGMPLVLNNGTRNYTADEQRRLFDRLITILEQFDRSEAERDILAREPVSKNGIFTDTFVDDFYRDQGAAQTAAVNRGVLQLAIDNVLMQAINNAVTTLDFTEEIVIRQDIRTSSLKINPYQNFTVMPGGLRLVPAVDFWTEEATNWTSPVTREFTTAPGEPPGQTTINEVTEIRRVNATTLRTLTVQATISGFGAGENLSVLTFDGVNVKPPGTQTANGSGEIVVSFSIPSGVPVGRRVVRAEGAAGSFAQTIYVGEGTIDITTMRRVTLVAREAPVPIVVVNNLTTVIQNLTNPVVPQFQQQEGAGTGGSDPLAQTFTLPEARHIIGVNFRFTAIGNRANGVRVQLSPVINGFPSNEVLAEAFISMATPNVGDLIQARFDAPVFCTADREYCFVILTADADHAVAIAKLGDVDSLTQTRVSAQPYTVGVLLTSANRLTWSPYQEADLHFQVVAAKFAPTSKTVTLWTGAFSNISDVVVRGVVEVPTVDARFRYELVRADGSVIPLAPGQTREFADFVTETVTLRAVLTGTEKISPIVYRGTLLVGGRIRTSGTYITRVFPMGSAIKVAAVFAAFLPAGSTVAVDVDNGGGTWSPLTNDGSTVIGDGWAESRWSLDPFTAASGRVRLTLNGGPGARVALARLRAYSV